MKKTNLKTDQHLENIVTNNMKLQILEHFLKAIFILLSYFLVQDIFLLDQMTNHHIFLFITVYLDYPNYMPQLYMKTFLQIFYDFEIS